MNTDLESILFCGKCGFAIETVSLVEHSTDPTAVSGQVMLEEWETDTEHYIINLRECPKCHSPFLFRYKYLNHHEAGSFLQEVTQLYPASSEYALSVESLPLRISDIYQKAKKCYDDNLFEPSVIMCRKCLEAMCVDLGAKGKNLADKIDNLHHSAKIDAKLLEWATHLRFIGNDAAHDLDVNITNSDAKDAITFLNALFLYIYTLDKKFEAFKERRQASKGKP